MCGYSHVHSRLAGSGFHLPSDAQTALILWAGKNSVLHLKYISAPSVVFWYASMKPFPGRVASLQLTEKIGWSYRKSSDLFKITYNQEKISHCCRVPKPGNFLCMYTAPVYKRPSSCSSVQGVSNLVHMLCTNWALAWAHVYISKQFQSLGTPTVTNYWNWHCWI